MISKYLLRLYKLTKVACLVSSALAFGVNANDQTNNSKQFYATVVASNLAKTLRSKGFVDKPYIHGRDHKEARGVDSLYAFLGCIVSTFEGKKFAIDENATSFLITVGDYRNGMFEAKSQYEVQDEGAAYSFYSVSNLRSGQKLSRASYRSSESLTLTSFQIQQACSAALNIKLTEYAVKIAN